MVFRGFRRSWIARVGCSAAMVVAALGVSAQPSSALSFKVPLGVVARDFQFLGVPGRLPAATYDVRFFNISRAEDHVLVALNLGPTCSATINTVAKAKVFLEGLPPGGPDPTMFIAAFGSACPGGSFGGALFAPPGQRDRGDYTLTPGRTLYFCDIPDDESGSPHFDLGMVGFIDVFALPAGF
ncbi:MAG: hypothetical protein ABIP03_06405 [Aquihabitans sp.]